MTSGVDWGVRADAAESAVLERHLRRVAGLPGTALGVVSWPAPIDHRILLHWHLWWQAQLLDCAIDAWQRSGGRERLGRVRAIARTIRFRNGGRWTNAYYDDMAWLGLALQRADPVVGPAGRAAVELISSELRAALDRRPDGSFAGIPWRRGDVFRNTPANGPAAILLARSGAVDEARMITDWIDEQLLLPTGLIADGIRDGGVVEPTAYSYCQGVVLGADLELARGDGGRSRIHRLVAAIDEHLAVDRVLRGHGAGDGGLFSGILARYLALVARQLPGEEPADRESRTVAARLVLDSAAAAWANAVSTDGGPLFGPDWAVPAVLPRRQPRPAFQTGWRWSETVNTGGDGSEPAPAGAAERDLSVQLSGWMLLEAAAGLHGAELP